MEIEELKASMLNIVMEMDKIKSKLNKSPESVKSCHTNSTILCQDTATVTPNWFTSIDNVPVSASPSPASNPVHTPLQQTNSKFNIIIFGITECPVGTSRVVRSKHDLDAATEIVSGLDHTISTNSVRDSFRLGKFSKSRKRLQPLLVKFLHS